ncbi:MAG: MFS transporter [Pirellulales bacterium]
MGSVRARLSMMMFLQYFVWGSWGVSIGGYMAVTLAFEPQQIGWIYSTTAIGAMIAPLFVGYIADRYFSTERILAALHIIGGALLCYAATQSQFSTLMTIMIVYALCYMPTLALTNSISFENINDPEKDFPIIRVFGTIGWIAAGIIVGSALGGTNNTFFYLAGGASIALGLFCLALPHTPPKGAKEGGDAFGLHAVQLLKEPSFAVFVFASFLICIPLAFYYNFANTFLTETDQPVPTAIQTLGQISEIFFMAAMPFFILKLGVKRMLAVGMLAWTARYLCFGSLSFGLILIGLVLHGVCYDFFFVASQIYVDKKAPRDMRASAQSFIAFVTLGVGMFVGAMASGWIVGQYPPVTVAATDAEGKEITAPLPGWHATEADASVWRYLDLSTQLRPLFVGEEAKQELPPDFFAENDANKDGKLQLSEIPETWIERKDMTKSEDDVTYQGKALREAFTKIDADDDGYVTRAEWRTAQAHEWKQIWMWPAAMAAVTCAFFWIGFREKNIIAPPAGATH